MKKNALVFSPILDGHRQVYAQYLIESLLKRDYQVYLVSEKSEVQKNYPYLSSYQSNPNVKIVGIKEDYRISSWDFRKLQDRFKIDLTVFAEADEQLKLLNYQLLPGYPRLRGKNVGIFIRSINYIHFPKQAPSVWNILLSIKHLPKGWHSNPLIFHEFTLPKLKLMDSALTLDEFFVEKHSKTHLWLPDLVFPLLGDDPIIAQTEISLWEPRLACFLEKNKGKEILLYFGEARQRKGYDTLLKLASEENSCFIHCGLSSYSEKYELDIQDLKNYLDSQGLLFETKAFIQSYQTMQLFFNACKYVVLPYRRHFGSSGVMLQAIHFGKPVLVANQGLMAARTQQHHLGLTYYHDDFEDLKKQWIILKETSQVFLNDLAQYKQAFSPQRVIEVLDTVLNRAME
jgi:glycosyltransferase involved in cell wall biosynthesis